MFRTSDIVLIAVMLSAAAFTYKTKHDADAMMSRIGNLEGQIQLEKDTIDVLKADWSLLTQPGRMQRLAETYKDQLGLDLLKPQQIVGEAWLNQIPMRPLMLFAEGEAGVDQRDPTVTGGVQP